MITDRLQILSTDDATGKQCHRDETQLTPVSRGPDMITDRNGRCDPDLEGVKEAVYCVVCYAMLYSIQRSHYM